MFDSDHISSCTSAGSVLQLCKISQKSNKPFRRSCAYKVHDPPFREILDSNGIPSCTSAGCVLQLCKVSSKSNKSFRRSCAYKVHGRTDRRTDRVIPIYPPPQKKLCLRGYKYEMNDPLHAQLRYLKHFSKLIFFK